MTPTRHADFFVYCFLVLAVLCAASELTICVFPAVDPQAYPADWSREPLYESPRSACWHHVRADWIADHPRCAFAGCEASIDDSGIEAHHVVSFHDDPSHECDPSNLISLCRTGENHHLWIGHQGNFKESNPNVREDCRHGRYPKRGWERKQNHDAQRNNPR